jgi:hypothetical protein
MAKRPVFYPVLNGPPFAKEVILDFEWHAGFAKSQAQKSIVSLHEAAGDKGLGPVLEISSKSNQPIGVALSAFNLTLQVQDRTMTVETAFQGSKVFERGGPFHDLYGTSGRDAKTDERIRSSGQLIGFDFLGDKWPTEPQTCFYDWLYVSALAQHPGYAQEVLKFNAFSDIAFNPEKSLNCQARSAALHVALTRRGLITQALSSKDSYLSLVAERRTGESKSPAKRDLFSDVG